MDLLRLKKFLMKAESHKFIKNLTITEKKLRTDEYIDHVSLDKIED